MKAWIAILMLLALSACARPRADNDADRMGRTTIDAVQRNDWIAIDKNLGAAMAADPQHAPKIVALQANFPADPPWSIKLIASSIGKPGADPKTQPALTTLNYLYAFPGRRLLIDLVVEPVGWRRYPEPKPLKVGQAAPPPPAKAVDPPIETTEPPEPKPVEGWKPYRVVGVYKLVSMTVTPVQPAAVEAAKFWAPGKTARQWAFLFATFATPAAMLAAAVAVLRARGLKRKWLWFLVSFVGVGAAWMDWTSGQAGLEPALNLVGFGLSKGPSPISPWILSFAPPAGALVAAIRLALHRPRVT